MAAFSSKPGVAIEDMAALKPGGLIELKDLLREKLIKRNLPEASNYLSLKITTITNICKKCDLCLFVPLSYIIQIR